MYAYIAEFNILLPEIFLSLAASALLLLGVYAKNISFKVVNIIVGIILAFSIYLLLNKVPQGELWAFEKLFKTNVLIYNLKLLLLAAAFVYLIFYKEQKFSSTSRLTNFEFPVIMLFAVVGMLLMLAANNFLSFYISLELQSLCLYIMAAFEREDIKASESGLKYFVLGSFASGLLLFGISLIYGFSGNLDFDNLKFLLSTHASNATAIAVVIGIILVLIGMFFKVSAAPFHMWTPDVYQGAPTIVTAFFATIAKISTIGFLLKFVTQVLSGWTLDLQPVLIFITVLSLLFGALGALKQANIKRLLAYSSILNTGFMLLSIASFKLDNSVVLYLTIYISIVLSVFAIIMGIEINGKQIENIHDLSGLSKTHPIVAFSLASFMFSLSGIPPFAGFFAKFYILQTAMQSSLYVTIIIALLSAVISAYYYLKIVKIMYLDEGTEVIKVNLTYTNAATILLLLLFNLCYILL